MYRVMWWTWLHNRIIIRSVALCCVKTIILHDNTMLSRFVYICSLVLLLLTLSSLNFEVSLIRLFRGIFRVRIFSRFREIFTKACLNMDLLILDRILSNSLESLPSSQNNLWLVISSRVQLWVLKLKRIYLPLNWQYQIQMFESQLTKSFYA